VDTGLVHLSVRRQVRPAVPTSCPGKVCDSSLHAHARELPTRKCILPALLAVRRRIIGLVAVVPRAVIHQHALASIVFDLHAQRIARESGGLAFVRNIRSIARARRDTSPRIRHDVASSTVARRHCHRLSGRRVEIQRSKCVPHRSVIQRDLIARRSLCRRAIVRQSRTKSRRRFITRGRCSFDALKRNRLKRVQNQPRRGWLRLCRHIGQRVVDDQNRILTRHPTRTRPVPPQVWCHRAPLKFVHRRQAVVILTRSRPIQPENRTSNRQFQVRHLVHRLACDQVDSACKHGPRESTPTRTSLHRRRRNQRQRRFAKRARGRQKVARHDVGTERDVVPRALWNMRRVGECRIVIASTKWPSAKDATFFTSVVCNRVRPHGWRCPAVTPRAARTQPNARLARRSRRNGRRFSIFAA
jgi:hypothetical protein